MTDHTVLKTPVISPGIRYVRWGALAAASALVALYVTGILLYPAFAPAHLESFLPATHSPQVLEALGIPTNALVAYLLLLELLVAASCWSVAALIFWHKPNEPFALYLAFVLVLYGAASGNALQPLSALNADLGWLSTNLRVLAWFAFFPLAYVFPNGRFVPKWTGWLLPVWIGLLFGFLFLNLVADWQISALFLVLLATGVGGQLYRYLRVSDAVQRLQTKWVFLAVIARFFYMVVLIASPLGEIGREPSASGFVVRSAMGLVSYGIAALFPVTIGIAILRYRLWDIDVILNRALVYGGLSFFVIGTYVSVVGSLSIILQTANSPLFSVLATGLVAVLFQPLRERIQHAVNRLIYGERDDPYAVLSQLGQRLEATLAPNAVLSVIVETVAQTLRLPYVAITLPSSNANDPVIGASFGKPIEGCIHVPLTYQGEQLGALVVAPGAPGESLTLADRRLLKDLARHAGVAVHAAQLSAALQRSRERLVNAREEERRRLRRDLHDGLGPALAAQTLKVGSARAIFPTDPAAADTLLMELERDIEAAIADVRRLVYNLRPPALDELGLSEAIRDSAARLKSEVQISMSLPDHLPVLPAAIEVAVYRIVQEALTNVVRHSQARHCRVRLALNGSLELQIADDGIGLPFEPRPGVGLTSMRERAEELGGRCKIESVSGGGTRVCANFPLRRGPWSESES